MNRSSSAGVCSARLPRELLGVFLSADGRLPGFAQRRLDSLLDKSKAEGLSREESRELGEMLAYIDQKSILLLEYAAASRKRGRKARGG